MGHSIDENLSVKDYLSATVRSLDGVAWLGTCVATIICLMDMVLGLNLIPLRESDMPGKAIVLLLFSPVITFLFMVRQRQSSSWGLFGVEWVRAMVCVGLFLAINF